MVPTEARHLFRQCEFFESMKTADREAATKRAYEVLLGWKEEVDKRLSGKSIGPSYLVIPTTEELERGAVAIGYARTQLRSDKLIRRVAKGNQEAMNKLRVLTLKWRQDFHRAYLSGDTSAWDGMKNSLVKQRGWQLESPQSGTKLALMIGQACIDALGEFLARIDGTEHAYQPSPMTSTVMARIKSIAKPAQSLMELFEQYAAFKVETGAKRVSGIDQDRMVVSLFAVFVGNTRSASSVSIHDARDFRNTIAKLPPNFSKRSAYKGLNIRQAAQKADADGEEPISTVTRARYISTISPFFDWLKSEGFTELQPFVGLHQKPKRGQNARPPLSTAQLKTIITSPLFTGCQGDKAEHLPGSSKVSDWRKWIPLVCLFTGARIGEIAQLRVNDIFNEHGIWFLSLKEDENTGQQTKGRKSRITPVHSQLEKIGFLDFVKAAQTSLSDQENRLLFQGLAPGKRGQYGDQPSDWWRDYLARIGVKKGSDGLGSHSFRHTISDKLRQAGYLDAAFGPLILGHSNKSVTAGYGIVREGNAKTLKDMIEAVTFDGVSFDHLYQ